MLLEHEPDQIATRHTQIRFPPNRFSIDQHLAAVGLVQASDHVEQRALPRPRPAGNEHQLTRRHVKVNPAQRLYRAEAPADIPNVNGRARGSGADARIR